VAVPKVGTAWKNRKAEERALRYVSLHGAADPIECHQAVPPRIE
jgi:hypothetical protein